MILRGGLRIVYKNKLVVSIIPARKGSKGIPRKNTKLLAGKPLIVYAIEASLQSKYVDLTILVSDDEEIEKISSEFNVKFIKEPTELAEDNISLETVMLYALGLLKKDPDYVVLLEPTSPLRTGMDIDKAIQKIVEGNGGSLLSVYENFVFFWSRNGIPQNYDPEKRPRRQEKVWEYVENGAIYITEISLFLKHGSRIVGTPLFYVMPKELSWDLDTLHDWDMTEYIISKHREAGGTDF